MEKKSVFIKLMYAMAAVMFVICVYMIIYNISYLNNYATSYGMTLGAMWKDVLQYIIAGSANYLAFGFIFLAIAKIVKMIEACCGPVCTCGGEEAPAEAVAVEEAEECECGCGCGCEEEVKEENVKVINGVKIKQRKRRRI